MMHQLHHLDLVAFRERGDDGAVLVDGTFAGMRPAVERQRQAAAIGDLADIANQDRAVRHVRYQDVEFGREADRHRIRAAARTILGVDMGVQLGDLRLCQLARELAHD